MKNNGRKPVRKTGTAILMSLSICLLLPLWVMAQGGGPDQPSSERNPAFEQEIHERLAAIHPDAVMPFQRATQAMDAGDLASAKRDFERVLELAPDFPDALRRLSYVVVKMGNAQLGIALARQALAVQESPYNHLALAQALLSTEGAEYSQEALIHAQAAAAALPDDIVVHTWLLSAGLVNEDVDAVRQASTTLVRIAPDFGYGHFFAGVIAAQDGKWVRAERELLRAQALGVPPEEVQQVLDSGIADQARLYRWLYGGAYTLGGWLVGMAILFPVGAVLSRWTLAAARRPQRAGESQIGRVERWLRNVYRVVITLTSLYFYISIPFLIVIVVAAGGGLLYLFFSLGRVPVRLMVFIALAILYTLIAIVRSIFTRVRDRAPGRPLSRDEAPQLWALAEDVAQRVDTRPIDAIYVTPGSEIAVTERGDLLAKLRGSGQRCLILGLGVLQDMPQGQFRAILAHEYGHFSNQDTAGGNLARQVSASIYDMAYRLGVSGQARWYNPAWLFVNGFYRVFLRITLGSSRLQEILADRYAAQVYGVQNFIAGLTHVIRQSIAFNARLNQEVNAAIEQIRALQNLYTLAALQPDPQEAQLEQKIAAEMSRPTSPYDSHPAFQERVALLQPFVAPGDAPVDLQPTWDLLPTADALQKEMTAHVQSNLQQQYAPSLTTT